MGKVGAAAANRDRRFHRLGIAPSTGTIGEGRFGQEVLESVGVVMKAYQSN